jgi:hypothetical protein
MSAGFSYKGVDIYTITNGSANTGNQVPGFFFKGIVQPNHSGLRPLHFGLNYQGISVSSYTSAKIITYTNPQTIPIPSPYKHFAFVGVSGGGGCGGNGGNANVNVNSRGNRNESGGSGASGSNASYMYGYKIPTDGEKTLLITIGSGGNKGTSGGNSQNNCNITQKSKASGGNGGPGNEGNATSIKIGTSTYKTDKAPGGNGGNGASVNWNGGSFNSNGGSGGNTPGVASITYGESANFNQTITYTYPVWSFANRKAEPPQTATCGTSGNQNANGVKGGVQIIWLYE